MAWNERHRNTEMCACVPAMHGTYLLMQCVALPITLDRLSCLGFVYMPLIMLVVCIEG